MALSEVESSLIKVTTLASTDLLRNIASGVSSNITLANFVSTLDPLLVAEGFLKSGPAAANDRSYRTVTTNDTYVPATDDLVLFNPAADMTFTLPASTSFASGDNYWWTAARVTNNAYKVDIDAAFGDTINGGSTHTLMGGYFSFATFQLAGSVWVQIA